MRISGRKFAITGAGRGLGAALAIVMADAGAKPLLLGRNREALAQTAQQIEARSGQTAETLTCDLVDAESCKATGRRLAEAHGNLDGLVHNGAMWLPGSMSEVSDEDIEACVASAAVGALILTRHVLPVLKARPDADIHTVISTSGLPYLPLLGTSVAFRAAKSAQHGLVQGLADELRQTGVRVTAVYPGNIKDISPLDPAWQDPRHSDGALTNREVIDAILFTLNLPPNAAVRSLVIEERKGERLE